MRPVFNRMTIGAAFAALHAATGVAQPVALPRAPAFRAAQLTELPRAGWVTNGGNLANQRYSPLTRINRGNVASLRAVWRASLGGSGMGPRSANQAQPIVYDGVVITGFAGGDLGTRGRVKAFDAKTGALKWTFYTVPGPGEVGHETWPRNSDVWKYGGASVW